MASLRREKRWVWTGWAVAGLITVALAVYLIVVGWDTANKVITVLLLLVAIATLVAPYLLPVANPGAAPVLEPIEVEKSGKATASDGGRANTGIETPRVDRPLLAHHTGDAIADGSGSVANTGMRQQPNTTP